MEGFARLVTYGYFTSDELLKKLSFTYSDNDFKFYEQKIREYISEAKYNSKKYVSTKSAAKNSGIYKESISTDYIEKF